MSSNWWAEKSRALTEQKRAAEEEARAAELRPNYPVHQPGTQAWIEGRRAQVAKNEAAAQASSMSYYDVNAVRERAHMRAVQAYLNTAHVQNRGGLARVEPNPANAEDFARNRPAASFSDWF
ncbi:hypothetical protein EF910_32030 [Streptomyces sp. WAC07149]|uniref:hypothetical protein n=1 Tax=Streptomyces sp. WAC07149 TaxID=2487425 RepID=UPI000F7A7E84|nr:hypothetical protein [Streptomyces sp. WAC07149]RST00366.1 hypothetical protein EF910_32030 [Streptomyces sp. WAC07149]